MQIGAKIREARLAKGMSQNELAAILGVSKPAISRYELGQRHLQLDQLTVISKALDIPLIDLVDLEPEKRAELHRAMQIISNIQERQLEGEYISDSDQWIYSVVSFLKHLVSRELATATVSDGPLPDDAETNRVARRELPDSELEEPKTPEQRKNRKRVNKLKHMFETLNDEGQRRVIEYTKDLCCIPSYKKELLPEDGTAT